MADIEFVEELKVFKPHDKAPDWVIANGELNGRRIVICEGKSGKYYAKYDNYQPKTDATSQPEPQGQVKPDANEPDWAKQGWEGDGSDSLPF